MILRNYVINLTIIKYIMDSNFKNRKTKKEKDRKTRELYGKYSPKHIRIQEKCQENHIINLQNLQKKDKKEKAKSKNNK